MQLNCKNSPEREIEQYEDMRTSAKQAIAYIKEIQSLDIDPKFRELLSYRLHNFNEFNVSLSELIKQTNIALEFDSEQSTFINGYICGLRRLTFDFTGTQKKIDDQAKALNEKLEKRIDQISNLFEIRNDQINEIFEWRDEYIALHKIEVPQFGRPNKSE